MKMKASEKILLIVIFIFILLGVYFSRTDLQFFEGTYVREDGLIEWLTVLALALGGGVCFYRARILSPFRDNLFILSLIGMGFVFFFGVGEEISWGQRILGIKSPDFFVQNNSQQETNLHNLIVNGKKINKIIFGTLLGIGVVFYITFFPYLYRKVEKVKHLVDRLAIPVPKLFHIIAYICLIIASEMIAGGKKGEILEFGGCWIFFLMLLGPYNRETFSRCSLER